MKFYRLISLIIINCLFVLTIYPQNDKPKKERKFSASEIKQDLQFLYENLEASHYNLFLNSEKKEFDDRFAQIQNSARDSMTLLEAYRQLQPFTALSELSHCNIGMPFAISYRKFVGEKGKLFPLTVSIRKNRMFVKNNFSKNKQISSKDEILFVNGENTATKLKKFYSHLSGETDYFKSTLIDIYSFPRLYWLIFDEEENFRLKIKKTDGKIIDVDVETIPAMEFEEKMSRQKSVFDPSRHFKIIENIGYLRPGKFSNDESKTVGQNSKGEFFDFIDQSFLKVKQAKIKDLIIDLRGNPGGDNSFSDPMVAYFANRPFRFASEYNVKTSQITKNYWKNVKDPLLRDLREKILTKRNGAIFQEDIKEYRPRTDSLKFKGRAFVLIDRYSYSNATTTAAIIKDYGFGVLIGEQTADTPTSYASIHQFQLPNTKLTVTYPKAFFVRPNGDRKLGGVRPDHRISDDPFTERDEILEFALKFIKNRKL